MACIEKTHTEAQESIWFMEWIELYAPLSKNCVHIANERKASKYAHFLLKKQGLQKGFPDYFICLPKGRFHGLFLEMKKRDQRNKRKRPEQEFWIEHLKEKGYWAEFVYGWEHAAQVCKDYVNERIFSGQLEDDKPCW